MHKKIVRTFEFLLRIPLVLLVRNLPALFPYTPVNVVKLQVLVNIQHIDPSLDEDGNTMKILMSGKKDERQMR